MKGSSHKITLSLYRQFKPEIGADNKMEGIIMAISNDQLEIYWNKIDGIYCPNLLDHDFTLCEFTEVIYGNQEYSPIKKKRL